MSEAQIPRSRIWPHIRMALKVAIVPALVLSWLTAPICIAPRGMTPQEIAKYERMSELEKQQFEKARWAEHARYLDQEWMERMLLWYGVSAAICVTYKLLFSFDELFRNHPFGDK